MLHQVNIGKSLKKGPLLTPEEPKMKTGGPKSGRCPFYKDIHSNGFLSVEFPG